MSHPKNIIITGASGLIGTGLLDLLRENKEYKVVGIYNNHKPLESGNNINYIKGDLTQRKIWDALRGLKVYAFIHCAAKIPHSFFGDEAEQSRMTNLEIDSQALSYAKEKRVKFIYLSSTSIYGVVTDQVCNEQCRPKPNNEYSMGKLESENRISNNGDIKEYFILRISAPYGTNQRTTSVLRTFIKNALQDTPLTYYGTGRRMQDFTYVKDVARACLRALESDNYGIYNIASGNSISMKDLVLLIKRLLKSKSQIKPANREDPQELYRPIFDISKAKRLLNWHPVYPLEKGLQEFIAYITENEL